MGYSLLLTLSPAITRRGEDPYQWSPIVFDSAEECRQFGRSFYGLSETVAEYSVADVLGAGTHRFLDGKLVRI